MNTVYINPAQAGYSFRFITEAKETAGGFAKRKIMNILTKNRLCGIWKSADAARNA
jgi:hypothetical protein